MLPSGRGWSPENQPETARRTTGRRSRLALVLGLLLAAEAMLWISWRPIRVPASLPRRDDVAETRAQSRRPPSGPETANTAGVRYLANDTRQAQMASFIRNVRIENDDAC